MRGATGRQKNNLADVARWSLHRARKYFKKALYLALFALLVAPAFADSFVIQDIRLKGLARISPGTVFNYLPVKVGDTFDERRSADAIKALFKTGLFEDVQLEREGDVLVVIVKEREAISQITFSGNDNMKTEDLTKALKEIGFAEGEVYDKSKLDKVTQELKRQYFAQGKYGVRIDTKVTRLEGNRVAIAIDVSEGKTARIRQINIVGNKAFEDKALLKQFKLSTPTMFSFFTKNDQYSKQKLAADLEALRSYYLDRGYVNFNVDSTQVSITPDKSDVYVTVNISEGDLFTVSDVKLSGQLIVPQEDLFKAVSIRKGMTFSRKLVTESSKGITDRLGDEGYAFANVNAVPDIKNEEKTVALTYFIDPGKRTYVRRINFFGNTRTRDEVLRREMRQLEGAWISTSKINRSKVRLQRLGYFESVNVETPAVPGTADQVDVNFTVVERASGNLLLGLGFSQSQGVIFNSQVTQDNFLGSGKRLDFAFNNSDVNRTYRLGYMNPYWTVDGVSRGIHAGYRETDAADANVTQYNSEVINAGAEFGIPLTEFNTLNLGLDFENTQLDLGTFASEQVRDFVDREGDEFNTVRFSGSFAYDTRNKAILPDRGTLHRIRTEVAIPGGDLEYYKVDYDARWFYPITSKYTLALQGRVGYGDAYGDTEVFPFFENFYAGGPRSVRGFEDNTLGPKDSQGDALGGNLMVVGNAEVILPVPFLQDIESLRITGFVDAGNVYGYDEDFDAGTIRYSAGLAGLWLSPFGVLTVSVAQPFNTQDGDSEQPFQFTFGTSF
ncbi:MAG: Outer membrane protein assembly factor BamA [Gammaproteobacteria bacterium]|nr:Outer membrane protein assembly factor BamA [Gammaproteobacteria bacterium]